MKDTYHQMPVKEFHSLLLKHEFKIGGCVDYCTLCLGEEKRLRDVFFYKGSALIKTTEFLEGTGEENLQNTIGCFGGHLTFNTNNLPYDAIDALGGSYGPFKGGESKKYHSVDIRQNLFKCVEIALDPNYLLPTPTLENGVVGMYILNNLVTRHQCNYAEMMSENLKEYPIGYFDERQIDNYFFGCYTLAKLIALKENLQYFTPEFKETLDNIIVDLDKAIEEKIKNHRFSDFINKNAIPEICKLIKNDKKIMVWHNITEDGKHICLT